MKSLARKLQNKKILITGGEGFLGSHLLHQIKQVCGRVDLYRGDVRNIDGLRKRYDIVCHLAALNKADSEESLGELFDVNVNGTLAVMRYCCRTSARCVFASSSAVYKPAGTNGLLHEDSCIEPVSLYGVSKMLAEGACKYYAVNFGVSVTALRIFNMYCPGQKRPFLIPYVIRQSSQARAITLRTPQAVRDFVYVADVAKTFILSCGHEHKGFLALNVGTGRGLNIYSVVKKLVSRMGIKPRINRAPRGKPKKDYVVSDTRTASKVMKWSPLVSIDEGLEMFVEQ